MWKRVTRFVRLWVDLLGEHELLTYASAIGFQTLAALVPLALLLLGILGLAGGETLWSRHIAEPISHKLSQPAFKAVDDAANRVFAHDSGWLVLFAALYSLWLTSSSVRACISGMNRVYGSEEDRPTWRRLLLSLGLAVAIASAVIGSMLLVVGGATAGGWLEWLRFPVTIAALGVAVLLLLRFGPVEPRPTRWDSLGTALVVLAWLVASLIFGWFIRDVANFRTAPGQLGVVLILTGYLYTSAIIFLVGVELDEQLREGQVQGILDLRGAFGRQRGRRHRAGGPR